MGQGNSVSSALVLVWLSVILSLSPHVLSLKTPSYEQKFERVSHLMKQATSPQNEHNNTTPFPDIAELQDILDMTSPEVRDAFLRVVSSMLEDDVSGVGVTQQQNVTSPVCLNHTLAVLMGLISRAPWAMQMLDAMGKPNPGITLGNLNWPGEYYQCLNVRANTTVVSPEHFSGRYCSLSSAPPSSSFLSVANTVITLGACVPDTCTSMDITLILQAVVRSLNVTSPKINPVALCVEETRPLNARAIVAIVVCSLILFMMVVGTIVDIIYVQWPMWTYSHHQQHGNDINDDNTASICSKAPSTNNSECQLHVKDKPKTEKSGAPGQLGTLGQVFVSFSVYTNGSKLLSTKQAPGSLTCVHGIRFLSMSWVVLGHTWFSSIPSGWDVLPYMQKAMSHWSYQAILNATVSVDTFFVLSGLLLTYLTLKELKKQEGKMNWFLFYFHRFWRLTPAYMLCLMVSACLAIYFGEGPLWPAKFSDEDICADSWWTNLLYINNFVNLEKSCFGHTWYLANDMQFYVLSPLILLPLFFYPLVGFVVVGVFLLATAITPGLLSLHYKLPPALLHQVQGGNPNTTNLDYMTIYYFKPYNRMGAYLVGMIAGYFLFRTNCKLRIHWLLNLVLWGVATAMALAVLYGLFESGNGHPVTVAVASLYNAVSRQAWGLSVAWVVVACVTGNGGFVNTILSWSAFVPLGRLTYCMYLLHLMLLDIFLLNRSRLFHIDDMNMSMLFLSILVVTCMVSFIASLAFEAPMMGLEKIFLRRPPPKPKNDFDTKL